MSYRTTDPDTARAASRTVHNPQNARTATLEAHRNNPAGLTDFELAALTGRAQTSIGVRRGELVKLGLIVDSGERRPSPSGRMSIVWRLAK